MARSAPVLSTSVTDAVDVLRGGGLVAIPTETVYGLAGLASDESAVRRIFAVKGRPADHPLIVHLARADDIGGWASDPTPATLDLIAACWPGPLTVLVQRGTRVLDVVTGGRPTVGLRVPAHPMSAALLDALGDGLAAPSANRFGRVSPTTAAHVVADLGSDVDLVLDGGACPIGVESTIVDCTVDPPQVLRPGAITVDQVSAIVGGEVGEVSGGRRAPGMLDAHYAPDARVVLADSTTDAIRLAGRHREAGDTVEVIDTSGDLAADARALYARLRVADDRGVDVVVAVLPPAAGLGHAIRDRLTKASGASAT